MPLVMHRMPLVVLLLLIASPAWARAWRGIDPGVSRRAEVVEKFGEPTKVATSDGVEILAYMGKQAVSGTRQVQFKLDPKTGVVQRIDVFPGPEIHRDAVEKSYGPACPPGPRPVSPCYLSQRTGTKQLYFTYPRLGLAVFFNLDEKTVNSLVFRPKETP
jgi:hypothetical protein